MSIIAVHPFRTTPECWEIAGYHPRDINNETSARGRVTIQGVLKDDGPKPEGAARKAPMLFSVSYSTNAKLADVAHFLGQKVKAGEDITNLSFD